ncbi:MAG: oligosaccharide flippase family protein [Flavobacteriaceae bacterium]|nr:oligosaccharide flippase family protein [Flavobacteriaceae bacterium]
MNIRKSLMVSFSQSYVLLAIQFLSSIVIARLLTPTELGVFSIVAVLVSVGNTVRDFGVVDYIVQEKKLTEDRIRSAISLTILSAWGIAVVLVLLSVPLAKFYRQEDVTLLLLILSINFVLLPFGTIIMANMRREMKFIRLAKIKVFVAITQNALALTLAYLGFSYFSMAWAAVLATIVTIIFAQFYRPKGFPILPAFKEMRRVFNFGSFNAFNNIMNDLRLGAPELVLGRTIGMEAVAFFGRANGIISIFNSIIVQSITYVALPHFSAQLRNGDDIVEPFLRSTSYLSIVLWPCFLFVGFAAGPLILTIYGDQWGPSIDLLKIIIIGEIIMAPFTLQAQLFISSGMVKTEFFRSTAIVTMRIFPLVIFSQYGLITVSQAYMATYFFSCVLSLWLLKKHFKIKLFSVLLVLNKSLLVFFALIPFTYLISIVISDVADNSWIRIFIHGFSISVGWLVFVYLFKHPIKLEINRFVRSIWSRYHVR